MTPSKSFKAFNDSSIFVKPPLISINNSGFDFFNFFTTSKFSGGMVLFCFGLRPFKMAFLA